MKGRMEKKCRWLLVPSFLGILVFYCIPFFRVLLYSMWENQFSQKWVWFDNYIKILKNQYFRLALKNSFLMIVIGVPILVAGALLLAIAFKRVGKRLKRLKLCVILPMLLPAAGVILVFRSMFAGTETALPVYSLYIWKNCGMIFILFGAAVAMLPQDTFEAARLDGAAGLRLHLHVTIPLLMPTILFVTLLGIVYSFRVFKESYLYYGSNYPPDCGYSLQYYMNNHFAKLNYQNLAAGAVITTIIICIIVIVGLKLQKKFEV